MIVLPREYGFSVVYRGGGLWVAVVSAVCGAGCVGVGGGSPYANAASKAAIVLSLVLKVAVVVVVVCSGVY